MSSAGGDEMPDDARAYRETRPRDAGTPAARAALEELCGSKEGMTAPGAAVCLFKTMRAPVRGRASDWGRGRKLTERREA